jgi:hypothetical protein
MKGATNAPGAFEDSRYDTDAYGTSTYDWFDDHYDYNARWEQEHYDEYHDWENRYFDWS